MKEAASERILVYSLTNLGYQEAGAERLLTLVQGHWEIEKRTRYPCSGWWTRDTLLWDDESRSSPSTLVQVPIGQRCAALTLLHMEHHREKDRSMASLRRWLEQQPTAILALTDTLG